MITENLELLNKAIAETSKDLDWMLRLRIAITSGNEELRLKILKEAGFKDPELFPEVKA